MRRRIALPASDAEVDHELKLVLPLVAAAAVTDWLRARCRPDPRYPEGLVSSLYYDTRDLASLRESLDGDYLKAKLRLRWYADLAGGRPEGPAFLEIKRKIGGRRFKVRQPTGAPAAELARQDLRSRRLVEALDGLRDERRWLPPDLRPVLEVRFRRRRFIEPVSGARVAIDTDVRVPRVNPSLLSRVNSFPLSWAVVEVKGAIADLPARLVPLRRMGCRREAFSKYARCYRKVVRREL